MAGIKRDPKTFNYCLGFEQGLWQRQNMQFVGMPKTSDFGAPTNRKAILKKLIKSYLSLGNICCCFSYWLLWCPIFVLTTRYAAFFSSFYEVKRGVPWAC
jgi:hypothetical protein